MSAPAEVVAHPASTLLLLRDGPAGLEVLMVTRHAETEVAGGALVFPGGRVDPGDGAPEVLGSCRAPAPADSAAMAFRVAAIRESFEEAHVLLARRCGEDAPIAAAALAALEEDLAVLLGRAPHFADLVASGVIELATDLMVPFAHWITPKGRSKRFDTHFFLAPVPADQVAAHDGREAVESVWISPPAAVAAADAQRASLVFATRMNLRKLGQSRDVASALAAARGDRIVTICPELYETPAGLRIRIPADAGYGPADMSAEDVLVTR